MPRILLVEDDAGIVSGLTDFLRSEGFEVESAPGQREALGLVETNRFDLLLLDVSLRDENCFAVCSTVKGKYDILLTASGDEGSVVFLNASGAAKTRRTIASASDLRSPGRSYVSRTVRFRRQTARTAARASIYVFIKE